MAHAPTNVSTKIADAVLARQMQSLRHSQELLLSVAEQIKVPLLQIARQAELSQIKGSAGMKDLIRMQATADASLALIDNYALAVRLNLESKSIASEPVSVSAILYDVGTHLHQYARSYGVNIDIHIAGRYGTVMANKQGLQAALVSLGLSLIEALPAQESPQLTLQLATHKCRYGVVAGLYTDTQSLTSDALRQAKRLHGYSRQPFLGLTHTSAAGVFVADALLSAMQMRLRASRHHKWYGLGAVLQPNHQLQLIGQ